MKICFGPSKRNRLISAGVLAALLTACGSPLDVEIPHEPSRWESEIAPLAKKLPEEDSKMLLAYLVRVKVGEAFGGKSIPDGFTIGQAIEAQKQWNASQASKAAEEAALKQKIEQDRVALEAKINNAVSAVLLSKKVTPPDMLAGQPFTTTSFRIGIRNKSTLKIVGVAGQIEFVDVFGKKAGLVPFESTDDIAPGAEIIWTGGWEDDFTQNRRDIGALVEGKYTSKFIPRAVVFEDGTKLVIPEE